MANRNRFEHHLKTSKSIKQLDRDKLLRDIQQKQQAAADRVNQYELESKETWAIFNEEEAAKKHEREKKI